MKIDYFLSAWQRFCRLPFPMYRLLAALICGLLAVGVLLFGARRRRVLWVNLNLCFPQVSSLQKGLWAIEHVYLYLRTFLDRGWLWAGKVDWVRERISLDNAQILRRLQAGGEPVIFFVPHFLGLDAAWSRLSIDMDMVTMYSNQASAKLNQAMLRGRSRYGKQTLLARQDGVRPVIKAMKAGQPLYYLPDMDFGAKESVFLPFFGIDAATVTAVARLSRLTGAKVVPVTTRYVRGEYRVTVHPPLENFPSDEDERATLRLNEHIEQWVQMNVPQYLWTHKRFKTRPKGQSKYY